MDDGALIMVACYDIYTVFIMEFMTMVRIYDRPSSIIVVVDSPLLLSINHQPSIVNQLDILNIFYSFIIFSKKHVHPACSIPISCWEMQQLNVSVSSWELSSDLKLTCSTATYEYNTILVRTNCRQLQVACTSCSKVRYYYQYNTSINHHHPSSSSLPYRIVHTVREPTILLSSSLKKSPYLQYQLQTDDKPQENRTSLFYWKHWFKQFVYHFGRNIRDVNFII